MKRCLTYLLVTGAIVALAVSCEKDDTDFSAYINQEDTPGGTSPVTPPSSSVSDTVYVAFSGTTATVSGDRSSVVTASGAHVVVNDALSPENLVLVLSGTTTNGSLLVYRSLDYQIVLNGVNITNLNGPAINNQCHKALYLTCADATTNTLTDGTDYSEQTFDQKGTIFSEGQIYFCGTGQLSVNGNSRNGIASDDYIIFQEDGPTVSVNVAATGTNGIKVNDGFTINGGILTIDVKAKGSKGINSDARTTINGGKTTITTSGDCLIETVDGVRDTSSCAGIKSDSLFTMTAGTLTITSTGDGGKGVNCSENVEVSGGTFVAKTTGDNEIGKPKAVKSLTAIVVSGGSFTASVEKSWACDNGTDSEDPAARVTIKGTPKTKSVAKKKVMIAF